MTSYGTIPTSSPVGGGTNLEYISRAKARLKAGLATRRPWRQMFNLPSITLPSHFTNCFPRIRINLPYFRMNYAIIILLILFLSLLWHPISLLVFVFMMAAWTFFYFLRDEPLVVFNRTIGDKVVLVMLSVLTIALLLLTHATVEILSAVLVGAVVVVVHAAVRRTDDLVMDEEVGGGGGGVAVFPGVASSSSS
ncbi:PRA1 family protein F2-like [Rhododendron vialii]|uniref:PRA1 family protein F2-like n=1 Tax=Rhododendron vialii TaxID=182163 RepID=UPI00265D6352|nr:PRA1 family protein F2-like [Rhododendron vialii]